MQSRYKHIYTIAFFFGVLGFNSCKQNQDLSLTDTVPTQVDNEVTLTDAQAQNAQIVVGEAQMQNIGHVISLTGQIEAMPEQTIIISSPHAGLIKNTKWIPGMSINKGQLLFTVVDKDLIQIQQDYLSAKTAFHYAQIDYNRQQELVKSQSSSDKLLQQAEEKMKQQEVLVKSLTEKLQLLGIKVNTLTPNSIKGQIDIFSPSVGSIAEVNINSGAYVHPGGPLMKIIDTKAARWVVKAFDKDLPYLEKGQKVEMYTNAQPDKKYSGKVEYIVNTVGDGGFVKVICKPDAPNTSLPMGMYINTAIEAEGKDSWMIVEDAVVSFEAKEYIFINQGNHTYSMVEITTGHKENGKTQILNFDDLQCKKVVIKGAYTLLMKMKNIEE